MNSREVHIYSWDLAITHCDFEHAAITSIRQQLELLSVHVDCMSAIYNVSIIG